MEPLTVNDISQLEIKPFQDVEKRVRRLCLYSGALTGVFCLTLVVRLLIHPRMNNVDTAGMILLATGVFLLTWGLLGCIRFLVFNASPRTERLVFRDEDTGLYTRRYFIERLQDEMSRACRHSSIFSILFIRVPWLAEGEGRSAASEKRKWKEVSLLVRSVTRREDVLARWEDDSLLLFLPNTEFLASYMLADRLEEVVGKRPTEVGRRPAMVSGPQSKPEIGCATFPFDAEDAIKLIRYAESAAHRNSEAEPEPMVLSRRITSV